MRELKEWKIELLDNIEFGCMLNGNSEIILG